VSVTVRLKFSGLAGFCSYLTSCSKDLLGKPIVFELVKDFSDVNEIRASYRVKMCPTLVSTSQLNPVYIVTRCISVVYVLLLLSLLQLYLESNLFPSGRPSKILYAFLLSPLSRTCPIHLISSLMSLYIIVTTPVQPP
jgi:hypothetical protein